MSEISPRFDVDAVTVVLRDAGARFAYAHGSQVTGGATARSDFDVAAWFGRADVDGLDLMAELPARVDLLVLDRAPLELAGRVALQGRLLFDDDPPARVRWEATTRKIYLDEKPRIAQARADFVKAWSHG